MSIIRTISSFFGQTPQVLRPPVDFPGENRVPIPESIRRILRREPVPQQDQFLTGRIVPQTNNVSPPNTGINFHEPDAVMPINDSRPQKLPIEPIGKPKEIINNPLRPTPAPVGAISSVVKTLKLPKGLGLIPVLLGLVINSKEKHLHNINVKIEATTLPKRYKINVGKTNGDQLSLYIQVQSGKEVQFLSEGHPEIDSSHIPISFFKHRSTLSTSEGNSYLPFLIPLRIFKWKRQEPHTECNIFINDLTLEEGPKTVSIPLSEYEGFNVVTRNPYTHLNPQTGTHKHDEYVNTEESEWKTLSSATVTISEPISRKKEHQTQVYPLPFQDGLGDYSHFVLSVTQE